MQRQPTVVARETSGPYYETKFVIEAGQTGHLQALLSHYFITPKNYCRGKSTTVYFDTADLQCYREGASGNRVKQKLRLRKYEDDKAGTSFSLERKERVGHCVWKKRLRLCELSRFEDQSVFSLMDALSDADTRFLLEGFRLSTDHLFPRMVIEYERARYICPHSALRLNVDWNIASRCFYPDRQTRICSVQMVPHWILELKAETIPTLPRELRSLIPKRSAFSKYKTLIEKNSPWQA